jgi:hypothetical protein
MRRCYITPKFTHNDVITLPISEKILIPHPKGILSCESAKFGGSTSRAPGDFIKDCGHCKYYTVKSSLVKSQAYSKASKFA